MRGWLSLNETVKDCVGDTKDFSRPGQGVLQIGPALATGKLGLDISPEESFCNTLEIMHDSNITTWKLCNVPEFLLTLHISKTPLFLAGIK
jgi:hypothetical protein